MALRPDEITEILEQELSGFQTELDIKNVGTVLKVGDAIATVYGLNEAMAGELPQGEARRHDEPDRQEQPADAIDDEPPVEAGRVSDTPQVRFHGVLSSRAGRRGPGVVWVAPGGPGYALTRSPDPGPPGGTGAS